MAKKVEAGMALSKQGVTISYDSWTDVSHDQLLAVAATTSQQPRQIYTLKTLNITSSPKTGDKTYELVKQEIINIESVNKVPVIAVVSDAAGEAAKARCPLILWRPDILTLDCYSHQFNLSVGGKS
ncbi:hypothetical protein ABBQ32_005755 [Trebouxia sp. C0010 RCD-2024]